MTFAATKLSTELHFSERKFYLPLRTDGFSLTIFRSSARQFPSKKRELWWSSLQRMSNTFRCVRFYFPLRKLASLLYKTSFCSVIRKNRAQWFLNDIVATDTYYGCISWQLDEVMIEAENGQVVGKWNRWKGLSIVCRRLLRLKESSELKIKKACRAYKIAGCVAC